MKTFVYALLIGLTCCSAVAAQDFARPVSLFADPKACRVGDVLTVIIVEKTSATNQSSTEIAKDSKFALDAGPGFGAWPFREIPTFGADGTSKNESSNQGATTRTGSITSQMGVKVVGIRPNGDLVIEGTKVLGINNDKEMLILTGIVRPQDITRENAVYSYQIADAQITYRGKGIAANGGKPGWIMRFLTWLF